MCTFRDNVPTQRSVASPADIWLLIYTKAQYGCAVGHTITFARIFYVLVSNRYSRELSSQIVNYHRIIPRDEEEKPRALLYPKARIYAHKKMQITYADK